MESILEDSLPWRHVEHVVITGGEPMIQRDLAELVDALRKRGHFVTIETAGTIYDDRVKPDFFSISPKLRNSYPWDHHSELAVHQSNNRNDLLPLFLGSSADCQFKFVVEGEGDVPEILDLIREQRIPRHKVCLMPQAVTADELLERGRLVAAICKRESLNFTGRLQIELWGNERGT